MRNQAIIPDQAHQFEPGLSIRPITNLKIGVTANYELNNNSLQYVTTKYLPLGNRYILGTIDQKTLGLRSGWI